MGNYDPYSVTLHILSDKKIEIIPLDVHFTLTLAISGRKVKEFYGKKPKGPRYNAIISAWRKE